MRRLVFVAAAAALVASGCSTLVGADFDVEPGLSASGGGGAGGGGGASASTSTSSTASTSPQGGGGTCAAPCYEGPEGTEDRGACKGGTHACGASAACEGQVLPAVQTCAATTDENCDGLEGCTGDALAAAAFAATGPAVITEVGAFDDGDVWVVGNLQGDAVLGGAPTTGAADDADSFVARLKPDGTVVWAKRYGGPGAQSLMSGELDPVDGNPIVAGTYTGRIELGEKSFTAPSEAATGVIAKLDAATGEALWATSIGSGGTVSVGDFGVSESGTSVLVGGFTGELALGGGVGIANPNAAGYDAMVVAVANADGAVKWAKAFGGSPNGDTTDQYFDGVAISPKGAVIAGGRYDGGFVASAALPPPAEGARNAVFVRLDAAGAVLDAAALPSTSAVASVNTLDFDGELPVLAGNYEGSITLVGGSQLNSAGGTDVFAFALGATGAPKWAVSFGGPEADTVSDVVVDAAHNVIATGVLRGAFTFGGEALASNGAADVFLLKLDATGKSVWARAFGGPLDDTAQSVNVDPLGAIVAGGAAGDAFALGEGPGVALPTGTDADAWAARFAP